MKRTMDEFIGIYSVSETLTFELKPVGKTAENLKNSGLLEQDFKRAEDYPQVKKILDEQHKLFLQKVLSDITDIDWQPLAQKIEELQKNGDLKADLEKLQEKYRKMIADKFSKDEFYAVLVKEATPSKLFKSLLETVTDVPEEIKTFARFACYFKGFQENRKNIYSEKAQQTSAAYRAVNENFTKFLSAVKIFSSIKEQHPDLLSDIIVRSTGLLNGECITDIFKVDSYNKFLAQSGIDWLNNLIGEINYAINQYRQQHKEIKPRDLPFMPILYKQILSDREQNFTIKAFEMWLVKSFGSIDSYDLMNEMVNYGCKISEKSDITYRLNGTEIYYDNILDRFYSSAEAYYRELEEAEVIY
jgi:CRISPR-associated protein Cpf1